MKNFESTTNAIKHENAEIKKIFDKQSNFLKGLILYTFIQYIILLAII